MNTKILIQTLTEIPDQELLKELTEQIKKHQSLIIPDIRKFFQMLSCLFGCQDRIIKTMAIQLYKYTFSIIIKTQIELSWNETATSLIRMLGEEDVEMRKKAKYLILDIIEATNNANGVLEKVYEIGLYNESLLVVISSMKLVGRILEEYPTVLHTKTNVKVMKLIMERIIMMTMNTSHIDIEKNSKQFLDHLFYLKIDKLDEVLTHLNEVHLERLQVLWAKNKQKMLMKQENMNTSSIQYQHLPLINHKFFGVYEPYVLKNIFNPEVPSAKIMAVKEFNQQYMVNEQKLLKYANVIYKILIRFIHEAHYELLQVLKKLVEQPGASNMINLSILPSLLVPQLNTENVRYRKDLREILKILHYLIPTICLKSYEEEMHHLGKMPWIQIHEFFQLFEHWIDNNVEKSYPPALNFLLKHLCECLSHSAPKIKEKSMELLLLLLDRYAGYRENLQDHFSQKQIGELEDKIQARKTKGKKTKKAKETDEIFLQEYNEERVRYLEYSKLIQK